MIRPLQPSPDVVNRVTALVGKPRRWTPRSGGFSSAGLWTISVKGDSHFVKASTTDDTARFLRDEASILNEFSAPFMPSVVAFDDDGSRPLLILEDLSQAMWPPPWNMPRAKAVLHVLEAIADVRPNGTLPHLEFDHYWPKIAEDHQRVVDLGVISSDWLDGAYDTISTVAEQRDVSGDRLVHGDIRSDNLCFADRTVVVDWNWASIGNPVFDRVAWLPTLALEGGPPPWTQLGGEPELVAALAGFFLHYATQPDHPEVRADLRQFQRQQAAVLLQWAARELDLPPPDGNNANPEIGPEPKPGLQID